MAGFRNVETISGIIYLALNHKVQIQQLPQRLHLPFGCRTHVVVHVVRKLLCVQELPHKILVGPRYCRKKFLFEALNAQRVGYFRWIGIEEVLNLLDQPKDV